MRTRILFLGTFMLLTISLLAQDAVKAPPGWQTRAPRGEVMPQLSSAAQSGSKGEGSFVVNTGKGEGQNGWWQKSYPISGGKFYQFHGVRKTEGVAVPRYSAVARVLWQDDKGKPVLVDPPGEGKGPVPTAEPEYP